MFGFKRSKLSAAIQLASEAIGRGRHIDTARCAVVSGNEAGAAVVFTEAMLLQAYALRFLVWNKYGTQYAWCDSAFFLENLIRGLKQSGVPEFHSFCMVISNGIDRLDRIPVRGEDRLSALFDSSVAQVRAVDEHVHPSETSQFLDESVRDFLESGCPEYFRGL